MASTSEGDAAGAGGTGGQRQPLMVAANHVARDPCRESRVPPPRPPASFAQSLQPWATVGIGSKALVHPKMPHTTKIVTTVGEGIQFARVGGRSSAETDGLRSTTTNAAIGWLCGRR